MKTTLHVINELYDVVNDYSIGTAYSAISGGVYKLERPDDSEKEDIVINCINITPDTVQYATANINIYVPDLRVNIAGKQQSKPNFRRLSELSEKYSDLLEYLVLEVMEVTVESQSTFKERETNQHYLNFRLKIRVFNN
jgi:hypothetical protein